MRMSRCMPGVNLDSARDEETYSGQVSVNLGPMRLSFAGAARVLERDAQRRTLRAIAAGRDVSGSGVRADVIIGAEPAGAGSFGSGGFCSGGFCSGAEVCFCTAGVSCRC